MANTKPWLIQTKEDAHIEIHGAKVFYKELSYGETRSVANKAVVYDAKGNPLRMDSTLALTLQVVHAITDWELTDENDNKLPISLETFDNKLHPDVVGEIIQKLNPEVAKAVSKEKKKK